MLRITLRIRLGTGPTERDRCAARAPDDAAIREKRGADASADRQQDRIIDPLGGTGGRFGQKRKMRVVRGGHGLIGEQRCQIDAVEPGQVWRPSADRAGDQTRNGNTDCVGVDAVQHCPHDLNECVEVLRGWFMQQRRRGVFRAAGRSGVERGADICAAQIDGKCARHPLTPALTMESTKKRCRNTKSISGGNTASVAPAMTRPEFIAPRL